MKKYIFVPILLLTLLLPITLAQAAFNTVKWGAGSRFYLSGVAPKDNSASGISIDVYRDSYFDSYQLDVTSLKVKMKPGSTLHLKSNDRKLFTTDVDTAVTKCYDDYSTWDYTADQAMTFTITWSNSANCAIATDENSTSAKVNNLRKLEKETAIRAYKAGDRISFIVKNIMEIITIKSVASQTARVYLSPLDRQYNLVIGKWRNIDIDGDSYRDVSLLLKNINLDGTADFVFKPIVVAKIKGLQPGDLIKLADNSAVYYLGEDGQRYVFPNQRVFFSWYDNFDKVKVIKPGDMAELPIGGLVTYRPGVRLVTFTTTKDVYVVSRGGKLRKLKDEDMARELYGDKWNKLVDDINDAFYSSYSFGSDLASPNDYDKAEAEQTDYNITADKEI